MVFNRSYYEDVLVVRVHEMVPREVWQRRFSQINDFERMLSEEGTTILKFFLHIDQKEQKKRLQQRLDDPLKRWKFSDADVAERKPWDQYMTAYEDVLSRTSTAWAPWRIIPSNHNWRRNLVVARAIVEAIQGLDLRYPEPPAGLAKGCTSTDHCPSAGSWVLIEKVGRPRGINQSLDQLPRVE